MLTHSLANGAYFGQYCMLKTGHLPSRNIWKNTGQTDGQTGKKRQGKCCVFKLAFKHMHGWSGAVINFGAFILKNLSLVSGFFFSFLVSATAYHLFP